MEKKKRNKPERKIERKEEFNPDNWKPKTEMGRKVKSGEVKDIAEILESGQKILEPEIVDMLLPNLEVDLIAVGQSKGKFGGGKRSIWRQTQKKTSEGNKPKFASVAIAGSKDGYIGLGFGKAKETVPARDKAIRQSKLNLIKIRKGCGSWECGCGEGHSIPFKVEGKRGSVIVTLIPAAKGTNLVIEGECRKMLNLAGIHDVYSKARGKTATKMNLIYACFSALKKLTSTKVPPGFYEK